MKKNPFDYPGEAQDPSEPPHPSSVPIIRLTHMLCGYPSSPVKNFEDGYEYTDEITGKDKRVRASELTETEFYELAARYKDELRRIYLEEKVPEETVLARKALEEKIFVSRCAPAGGLSCLNTQTSGRRGLYLFFVEIAL